LIDSVCITTINNIFFISIFYRDTYYGLLQLCVIKELCLWITNFRTVWLWNCLPKDIQYRTFARDTR